MKLENKIDIVDIRMAVRNGILNFYIKDDFIYCENLITKENVIISNKQTRKLNDNL